MESIQAIHLDQPFLTFFEEAYSDIKKESLIKCGKTKLNNFILKIIELNIINSRNCQKLSKIHDKLWTICLIFCILLEAYLKKDSKYRNIANKS